jgi:hypothetical protein
LIGFFDCSTGSRTVVSVAGIDFSGQVETVGASVHPAQPKTANSVDSGAGLAAGGHQRKNPAFSYNKLF